MTDINANRTSGGTLPDRNLKDQLYSPMLTRRKFGKDGPKSRRWIIFALMSALGYSGYNYMGGINKLNPIATRCFSTFVSLIFCIGIQIY